MRTIKFRGLLDRMLDDFNQAKERIGKSPTEMYLTAKEYDEFREIILTNELRGDCYIDCEGDELYFKKAKIYLRMGDK